MEKSDREVLDRAFNEVKRRIIRLAIERDKLLGSGFDAETEAMLTKAGQILKEAKGRHSA